MLAAKFTAMSGCRRSISRSLEMVCFRDGPLPMMIRVSSSGFLCGVTEVRRGDSRNLAVPVSVSVMFLNVSGFIGVCVD